MSLLLIILSFHALSLVTGQNIVYKQFSGATLSYTVDKDSLNDNYTVHIDVMTGWKFGQGPCGAQCSQNSIGTDTRYVRNNTADPAYFGNWSVQAMLSNSNRQDIPQNTELRTNMQETVIRINRAADWEQENLIGSILLGTTYKEVDVIFEGQSWKGLSSIIGQNGPIGDNIEPWHFQAKIEQSVRNDTQRPNSSPQCFAKPLYRVKLDEMTAIRITCIDPDGDMVGCELAQHVEAGRIGQHPLPGVTVDRRLNTVQVSDENCIVRINASTALGYSDGFHGVVTLMVRDYNREDIVLQGTTTTIAKKYLFMIGSTSVQFMVHVVHQMSDPVFVSPTLDHGHQFTLYAGTKWATTVYAQASQNREISRFIAIGRTKENLVQSTVVTDTSRSRVKYVDISWTPGPGDVGHHILCVGVEDDSGIDASQDRCFILRVTADTFSRTSPQTGIPYFVDLPSMTAAEMLVCQIDTTCVIPLFVKSDNAIVDIEITKASFSVAYITNISSVQHRTEAMYHSDLYIGHSMDGKHDICFIAKDDTGVSSQETCIQVYVQPEDPCNSAPCKNSATCNRSPDDPADYTCACLSDLYSGKNCQIKKDLCDPNPCKNHGYCNGHTTPVTCLCSVAASGFTGDFCEINEDDCTPTSCQNYGLCKDGIGNTTCQCFDRYSGPVCEHDSCSTETKDETHLSCAAGAQTCSPPCDHGVCDAGRCVCSLGHNGSDSCNTATGNLESIYTTLQIVPPSLAEGSVIICYNGKPCSVYVYAVSPLSDTIATVATELSDEIKPVTVLPPTDWLHISGLSGVQKVMLTCSSTTVGRFHLCVDVSDSKDRTRRCYVIDVRKDPTNYPLSAEGKEINRAVKFVDPTPRRGTSFSIPVSHRGYILLYTQPDPSAHTCKQTVTTDPHVTVMPTTNTSDHYCLTEASYLLTVPGGNSICFQSTVISTEAQTVCYNINAFDTDPCKALQCQNEGICLPKEDPTTDVFCKCVGDYVGDHCEQGPCHPSENHCQNGGYCEMFNHQKTCFCPVGFTGTSCETNLPDAISSQENTENQFSPEMTLTEVTCIRNRKCTVPLIWVSTHPGSTQPQVKAGFTSQSIRIESVTSERLAGGTFESTFIMVAEKLGRFDVCAQTVGANGANQDENCFKVNVIKDTSSLYGDKTRPHFIDPSLPDKTELSCVRGQVCHVLAHVTVGLTHQTDDCAELHLTQQPVPQSSYIFTSCRPCIPGSPQNVNCSFDVSIVPKAPTQICLTARTEKTQIIGEERCYELTVVDSSPPRRGCSVLHCQNHGFCDGHGLAPICHCPRPFVGAQCEQDLSKDNSTGFGSQVFVKEGIPQEVQCYLNTPCIVPFHIHGTNHTITTGYTSPSLTSHIELNPNSGTVTLSPHETGSHDVCIQSVQGGTTADEICTTITVHGGQPPPTDKSRPYYVEPTLPKDTRVICEIGTPCVIDMFYTKGATFSSSQQCPTLTVSRDQRPEGMYIFPSMERASDCFGIVSYVPQNAPTSHSERVCFTISLPGHTERGCLVACIKGKRGENRCYTLEIVPNAETHVPGPCISKVCLHDGVCLANLDRTPPPGNCLCTRGFKGPECSLAIVNRPQVPGASSLEAVIDTTGGMPTQITCEANKPCTIPIPYLGSATSPPSTQPINESLPVTNTTIISHGVESHVAIVTVTGTTPGTHEICLPLVAKKPSNASESMDDSVCFNVTVKASGSEPPEMYEAIQMSMDKINQPYRANNSPLPDTSKPHFSPGTINNGSTIGCKPNSTCHLTFITPNCSGVRPCGSGRLKVHVFPPKQEAGFCVTDVAVTTGVTETNTDFCIKAGHDGEERHIAVEHVNYTDPILCDEKAAVTRMRRATNGGLTSCYCSVMTPDGRESTRLHVIKRNRLDYINMLYFGGYGFGGSIGLLVIVLLGCRLLTPAVKKELEPGWKSKYVRRQSRDARRVIPALDSF